MHTGQRGSYGQQLLQASTASHPTPLANAPDQHAYQDAEFAAGVVQAVSGLLTFFGSPFIGVLSDSMGRRPLLILAQATSMVPTALILLYSRGTLSLWPYFVAQATSGLIQSTAILLAFVADTLSPANRAAGFGLVLAFFSFSLLATPLAATFIPDRYIFTVAIGAGAASTLYAAAVVPETLMPHLRKPWTVDKVRTTRERGGGRAGWRRPPNPPPPVGPQLNPVKDVGILVRTRLFRRLTLCVMIQSFATVRAALARGPLSVGCSKAARSSPCGHASPSLAPPSLPPSKERLRCFPSTSKTAWTSGRRKSVWPVPLPPLRAPALTKPLSCSGHARVLRRVGHLL